MTGEDVEQEKQQMREESSQVLEGVPLAGRLGEASLGSADLGLDLVGVDDASEVGVGHDAAGEGEGLLDLRGLVVGSEDAKRAESACKTWDGVR
eukprot:762947-Hanusia_phi.AAC.13